MSISVRYTLQLHDSKQSAVTENNNSPSDHSDGLFYLYLEYGAQYGYDDEQEENNPANSHNGVR